MQKQNIIDFQQMLIILLSVSVILNFVLLSLFRRNKIQEGDIVFFTHPDISAGGRNIITSVLDVFPKHNTAVIRIERTTMVVSCSSLTKLPVDKAFPVRFPGKPKVILRDFHGNHRNVFEGGKIKRGEHIMSPGNRAKFFSIPLSWFYYGSTSWGHGRHPEYYLRTTQ